MASLPRFLFALPILLSSCSWLGSDEPRLHVETTRESYDLGTAERITVVIENISSSAVHFSQCMPATLQQLGGDRVVATLGYPLCECICPEELGPGERRSLSFPVGWIAGNRDRFQLGEAASFRLLLQPVLYKDRQMNRLLGEERLGTNRFVLAE